MAVSPESSSFSLPCCLEVPASFLPKATYGVEMLLRPLGIDPTWVPRHALSAPGLYYGTAPEGLPEGVFAQRHDPTTAHYFEVRRPYDPRSAATAEWDGEAWPVLFGTPGEPDLVASTVFWLTGWQEYTTTARDRHGRFRFADALQPAFGVVSRPPVDAYREMLARGLSACGAVVQRRRWGEAGWVLCPTHDIDYLRKWRKGMVYREVVSYFLANGRRVPPGQRFARLGGFVRQWARRGDVYRDAIERLRLETRARGGTATFFFKAGAHGPHDVPYRLDHSFLVEQLRRLHADGFEVGLHPSYHADTHAFYHRDEREALGERLGAPPASVRQHYLRFDVPATPRLQARLGYTLDSSLGFAEHEGFRNGTCLPFQVYDPVADAPLPVWEMPLSVMESALFNRRGLDPASAGAATDEILAACRRFGGAAVMLWHNILWDELDFPGWGDHFIRTLDRARADGAAVLSLSDAWTAWQAG